VIAMADLALVRDDWAWRVAASPDPAIRACMASGLGRRFFPVLMDMIVRRVA